MCPSPSSVLSPRAPPAPLAHSSSAPNPPRSSVGGAAGSGWGAVAPLAPLTRSLYTVPTGALMRLYSNLSLTRFGWQALDTLYVYPANASAALTRAMLRR